MDVGPVVALIRICGRNGIEEVRRRRRQQPDFKYPNIAGPPLNLRLGGVAENLKARNLAGKFHRGNALADGKARLRAQREHVEGCVSFSVITQPKGQTYGAYSVCILRRIKKERQREGGREGKYARKASE